MKLIQHQSQDADQFLNTTATNHHQHPLPDKNVDTSRLRQNDQHFPDDVSNCIFLNENVWISIRISLKFVPKVPIDNKPSVAMPRVETRGSWNKKKIT